MLVQPSTILGVSKEAASAWLGWASVGCWVCAQMPQMVENVRLQSCEGLALPFLLNWLFGDLTNLLGCVLTDQLPFQTYIAAYFCLVDIALTGQFFYYRRKAAALARRIIESSPRATRRAKLPRASSGHSAHGHARVHSQVSARSALHAGPSSAITSPHLSLGRSRSRSGLQAPVDFALKHEPHSPTSTMRPHAKRMRPMSHHDSSTAALLEAADEVARAVERVQHHEETRRRRDESRTSGRLHWSTSQQSKRRRHDGDEAGLGASFHSEVSASSATTDGRRTAEHSPVLDRGRSSHRPLEAVEDASNESESALLERASDHLALPRSALASMSAEERAAHAELERQRSKSRGQSIARGSRQRAAGVLFMGFWTLVGFSTRNSGEWKRTAREGLVLRPEVKAMSADNRPAWRPIEWTEAAIQQRSEAAASSSSTTLVEIPILDDLFSGKTAHQRHRQRDIQRFIGRVSAWICTTLYLTSRLPQIWKNYMRKSCEGLSVLLFVFAFMGNLTYVIGVLVNPAGEGDPEKVAHYLLESLPYLLGSAGTLIFDLIIMIQSFVYRSQAPIDEESLIRSPRHTTHHLARSRSRSHMDPSSSEAEPLIRQRSLSTDSLVKGALQYTNGSSS